MTMQSSAKANGNLQQTALLAPMPRLGLTSDKDVMEHIAIACMLCDADELIDRIRIAWNARFISRMGDARWDYCRGLGLIRLSLPLWHKASHVEQAETITHEACHLIADYKFRGRQMHGPRWQEMMRLCGYENPRRCHRVNLDEIRTRRLRRRISAACGCPGGILVTPLVVRHVKAGAVYLCRTCRQPLTILPLSSSEARGESEIASSKLIAAADADCFG